MSVEGMREMELKRIRAKWVRPVLDTLANAGYARDDVTFVVDGDAATVSLRGEVIARWICNDAVIFPDTQLTRQD